MNRQKWLNLLESGALLATVALLLSVPVIALFLGMGRAALLV